MHGIRRPSSQNGRRTAKRLGDEYQNFFILVAQDSSLKATAIIAVGGNQALRHHSDSNDTTNMCFAPIVMFLMILDGYQKQ